LHLSADDLHPRGIFASGEEEGVFLCACVLCLVLQVEAARAGMGLAPLPSFMGDQIEGLVRIPNCKPYANYDV
jgi:hypothetical protein